MLTHITHKKTENYGTRALSVKENEMKMTFCCENENENNFEKNI